MTSTKSAKLVSKLSTQDPTLLSMNIINTTWTSLAMCTQSSTISCIATTLTCLMLVQVTTLDSIPIHPGMEILMCMDLLLLIQSLDQDLTQHTALTLDMDLTQLMALTQLTDLTQLTALTQSMDLITRLTLDSRPKCITSLSLLLMVELDHMRLLPMSLHLQEELDLLSLNMALPPATSQCLITAIPTTTLATTAGLTTTLRRCTTLALWTCSPCRLRHATCVIITFQLLSWLSTPRTSTALLSTKRSTSNSPSCTTISCQRTTEAVVIASNTESVFVRLAVCCQTCFELRLQ